MSCLIVAASLLLITNVACYDSYLEDDEDFPVVYISNGPIMGKKVTSSRTNKTYYGFQGIPYAAPPVGNLRFKDPQPHDNWTEVVNCTRNDTDWCMQFTAFDQAPPSVSEDCLFINVYSPQINVSGALWPVMVWVHGGGWFSGSGAYELYGPDMFLAEGIVVVTFNYRLGAFGFLSLGIPEAPGNVGLKDQRFAFKWVKNEIEQFGGDPNRVTITGESAGSFSIHLHYLSPLSKGLFHGVIGESGTALISAVRENGISHSLSLASLLNCSTADAALALDCLLNATAEDILLYQNYISGSYEDSLRGDGLVWRAVVDVNASSDPFLPAMPLELYQQGQGSFVPFIMGTNRNEGNLHLGGDAQVRNITNITNLELLIPEVVRGASTQAQIKMKAKKIDTFYFNGTTPTVYGNIVPYIDLYTDLLMAYPTAVSARLYRSRGPVYLYHFVFDGSFKTAGTIKSQETYNISLVGHAEEMNYLFVIVNVTQTAAQDSKEMRTWRRMVRMWTNFVKYGTPTTKISDDDVGRVSWDPIDNTTSRYLSIDVDLTMCDSDYMGPHVQLWDSINAMPSGTSQLYLSVHSATVITALVYILV